MSNSAVAILGIGTVGFGRFTDQSTVALADQAVAAALSDAELSRSDIDGLVVHIGSPRGADYDTLARLLALDVRFASQTWAHGRFTATVLAHATMAIREGLADRVLCVAAFRNSAHGRYGSPGFPDFYESFRDGGGAHTETPHVGLLAPVGGAAMATQRYLHKYGIDRELLAAVPMAQRAHAVMNPLAVMRDPLDEDAYRASRYIVEPLRLLDCSVPTDVAIAVILGSPSPSAARKPVNVISFQGLHAGPDELFFGQPGLGVAQAGDFVYEPRGADEPVFVRAGLAPDHVDTFHCYDGFSPQVLWTLERFGFCGAGEAAEWVQGGRIGPGGSLPVNTSGGHLSEGHSNGWGQIIEIVRQLRGEAGDRQIPNCAVGMWATTLGDAVLFGG